MKFSAKRSPLRKPLKEVKRKVLAGAIISKLWFYNVLFCLVRTEFSTWVNLSLYVIAVLRSENIGFKYMTMNQVSGAIISKLWFYNALFCLVRTEFSTWVNLSLYVIAVLRSENIGFKYMTMNQVI
ncbi:hypothetical protein [Lactococcus cremoris]|uniref:hypothetical protein n=1 Tax=Lactococcus lactis subsp. cremoris TaxID=1359 RepID=UPI002FC9BB3F